MSISGDLSAHCASGVVVGVGAAANVDPVKTPIDPMGDGGVTPIQVLILLVGSECIRLENQGIELKLAELDERNKWLGKLNEALAALQAFKATLSPDTKPEDKVTLPQAAKDALTRINIDPATVTNYGELLASIEQVRGKVDKVNSMGQTDATRLQMKVNMSQVWSDMTTNTMQTILNAMKSITRNLV